MYTRTEHKRRERREQLRGWRVAAEEGVNTERGPEWCEKEDRLVHISRSFCFLQQCRKAWQESSQDKETSRAPSGLQKRH